MPTPEELTVEFSYERCIFNTGEDRTIIGECMDTDSSGHPITVKGKAAEGALENGLIYRFLGYWTTHYKYGKQFAFHSFVLATPNGQRGTIAYLKRCKGIGPVTAKAIWEAYGSDALEILKAGPGDVAAEIKGVTLESATAAAEYFTSIESLEKVTIELTDLLSGRGFPKNLSQQCIEKWGERAPGAIKENPYVLMLFRGVGFLRADQLYLELGNDPAALVRQKWCLWHALASDSEGHTWYSIDFIRRHLEQNIAGAGLRFVEALDTAIAEDLIVDRTDRAGTVWVAETEKAVAEARLANFVHQAEVE